MTQANGLSQIEVYPVARDQVAAMAKAKGKLRRQEASDIINNAFMASRLKLPKKKTGRGRKPKKRSLRKAS